ncbi:hypothetical protein PVAP13_8KG106100 [Panicum virgatum]|uniref:Uncharacterized protein n=1 Tax=Panicum virgatum TaxID=38727 RepID=A0A8T0PJD1_PANVG|nr:hypothetical protein PVAP13_8KG106100 [Panicum virgatum]
MKDGGYQVELQVGTKCNLESDQLMGTVRYHWTKAFFKKIVPLGTRRLKKVSCQGFSSLGGLITTELCE